MKYKDIKEKHIYYVDFDKVKHCEFDGNHQALVLKKNPDKQTLIVVPLTTEPNGRKVCLDKISALPNNLKENVSYAVCNQVRTVNHSRFCAIKDDTPQRNRMDVPISNVLFEEVLLFCMNELIEILELQEKINLYHKLYSTTLMLDVVDIAYKIKRLPKDINEEVLRTLQYEIVNKLNRKVDFNNSLDEVHKKNGIGQIIQDCLDNTIYERLTNEKDKKNKNLKIG